VLEQGPLQELGVHTPGIPPIAAGHDPGAGDAAGLQEGIDQLVAFQELLQAEPQPGRGGQLVQLVRVRAADHERQIRPAGLGQPREAFSQPSVVNGLLAGSDRDIDRAGDEGGIRPPFRIPLRLIQGPAGRHVDAQGGDRIVAGGEGRGAVALVGVHIDDPGPADAGLGLQPAQRGHEVVHQAESRAVVLLGMVHAAAEIKAEAAFQSPPAALESPPRPDQNSIEELRERTGGKRRLVAMVVAVGVDQLVGADDFRLQAGREEAAHIVRGMHPQEVLAVDRPPQRIDVPGVAPCGQMRVGRQPGKSFRSTAVQDRNFDPEVHQAVELSRVVEDHVVVFRQHYFEKFGK